MTTTTLTSQLEAINTLLDAIGESPVDNLDSSGLVDVAKARDTLDEISRLVQTEGWTFNSEDCFPFSPDSYGFITLPGNILKFDSSRLNDSIDVVLRGNRAYDRKNHTYTFKAPLKAEVVWLLPWDELPQAARHYIMIRAARVFQARGFGSDTQHKFSEAEEMLAKAALEHAEVEAGDFNVLYDNYSTSKILMR
jgi:hypothetical protein